MTIKVYDKNPFGTDTDEPFERPCIYFDPWPFNPGWVLILQADEDPDWVVLDADNPNNPQEAIAEAEERLRRRVTPRK